MMATYLHSRRLTPLAELAQARGGIRTPRITTRAFKDPRARSELG
jgi:hypothetical protein